MATWDKLQNVDLRDLLSLLFSDSIKFDAFVSDFFTDTYKRFSSGMDTELKVSLLFGDISKQNILLALQRKFPQTFLDDQLEIVNENARRKTNPSLFVRVKHRLARMKLTISISVLLAVVFIYGDTAMWRSKVVPLMMIYLSKNGDPSLILEGALSDFQEKNYKGAVDKATCIIMMLSSNEEQKREAKVILLSIDRIKSENSINSIEEKSIIDGKLPDRLNRIHEIATQHTKAKYALAGPSNSFNEHSQDAGVRIGLSRQDAGIQDAGIQDADVQDANIQDAGIQDAASEDGKGEPTVANKIPTKKNRKPYRSGTPTLLSKQTQVSESQSGRSEVAEPAATSPVPSPSVPPDMSRSLAIEDYIEPPDHHKPTLETLHPKMIRCFEGADLTNSKTGEIYLKVVIAGDRVTEVTILNKKTEQAVIDVITPERKHCILKIFDQVRFPERTAGWTTFPWYNFRVR